MDSPWMHPYGQAYHHDIVNISHGHPFETLPIDFTKILNTSLRQGLGVHEQIEVLPLCLS
jgi:hypothetical protein